MMKCGMSHPLMEGGGCCYFHAHFWILIFIVFSYKKNRKKTGGLVSPRMLSPQAFLQIKKMNPVSQTKWISLFVFVASRRSSCGKSQNNGAKVLKSMHTLTGMNHCNPHGKRIGANFNQHENRRISRITTNTKISVQLIRERGRRKKKLTLWINQGFFVLRFSHKGKKLSRDNYRVEHEADDGLLYKRDEDLSKTVRKYGFFFLIISCMWRVYVE